MDKEMTDRKMTHRKMTSDMDAALAAWARDDRGSDDAVERLLAHADTLAAASAANTPAASPARRWLPWAAGGSALAASVAVALLLQGGGMRPGISQAPAAQVAAVQEAQFAGQESFALLHTPTDEEERFL